MVNDNCSICLEALIQHGDGEMEPIGAALCGHCYHVDCFWRWEQAKTSQNMRIGRYSAPCPCPVCNAPVQEFIRLYIDAAGGDDKSENEKLKKELHSVKKKLVQERLRHQRTQKELAKTNAAARLTAPESRATQKAKSRKPAFMQMAACGMNDYDDDIRSLCDTVRLFLSAGSSTAPSRQVSNQPQQQSSQPRQQESSIMSFPPPPVRQSQSPRRNTRRLLSITTNSPSSSLDVSAPGDAPSRRCCRTRTATPRPDPPLGNKTSSRTTRNAGNRNRTSTANHSSSLSPLRFAEYDSPSCHAHQQESLEAAEARLSSRILSRLSSGGSLDPPSLRN